MTNASVVNSLLQSFKLQHIENTLLEFYHEI
jgi:hypothetical protein